MKMYYYNPNDYGDEFFVMAENRTEAHKYLIKHLGDNLEMWGNVNPLDNTTFPCKYTLDEYEMGSVIQS